MTVYPKIRGIPEEMRKQNIREVGRENNDANRKTMLTKEKLGKFTKDKERKDYNTHLAKLIQIEERKAQKKVEETRRKEAETVRKMEEQKEHKHLQSVL